MIFDAILKAKNKNGEREIPLEEYFIEPGKTALSEDEVLTEIELPPFSSGSGSAFAKIARVSADLAKINVAVYLERKRDVCEECRIAFGSVAPTTLRAKQAESMMRGEKCSERIIEMVAKKASEEITPITDMRSTKEYRGEMSKVMTKRLLTKAWERAGG
jgi:carbon-monoxide dehydrogenase medium subunit